MSKKQHTVSLTGEENAYLFSYITTGVRSARSIKRAQILLLANRNNSDPQIANQLGLCKATVYNIRRRYCTEGLEAALHDKPRPGAPKKFDGRKEARFTAIACSDPPMGRQRWTLRLLTDKVVELELVESISPATVRSWLKKTNLNPGRSANGASARSAASSSC